MSVKCDFYRRYFSEFKAGIGGHFDALIPRSQGPKRLQELYQQNGDFSTEFLSFFGAKNQQKDSGGTAQRASIRAKIKNKLDFGHNFRYNYTNFPIGGNHCKMI